MPLEVVNITLEHIEAFLADQLERLRPASARARFASLRQFFACLASRDEREIERSPMENLKPPKVPTVPVPVLSLEHLKALLRAVERDRGFYGRRDAALIRSFIDAGCRLTELSGLDVGDVDLDLGTVTSMGKGGGERRNPIGTKSIHTYRQLQDLEGRSRRPDPVVGGRDWALAGGPRVRFRGVPR
jgi:site-specific recombinase XerC